MICDVIRIASEAMINEQQWEKAHAPPEDEEGQGGRLVAFDMDEVALKYTDEKVYVRAGDSVCYNHKVKCFIVFILWCLTYRLCYYYS